ncbi:MAG: DNA ligase-associated DEXH box helicase, partial [Flavobacteriales bacterium]|nr:DNA ligase-associated DEXH box helicase [Flavobacteriales bacterium]
GVMVRADVTKEIEVRTIIPPEIEKLPWAGHIGIKLVEHVIPIIENSESTLLFTNTRAQCEIWFHRLLDQAPQLAGTIAMHHGSISRELRHWVEDALYNGELKAVVCTSSLDLGVDFRPVDSIVQIGGPKGVARFVQRAGRSGHRPGAKSKIYFLPTHSLELIEAAALRQAIKDNYLEDRVPYFLTHDVLVQYMMTLAVSEGFDEEAVYKEVISTHAFADLTREEWEWNLRFITSGGTSLRAYKEYRKAVVEEGKYSVVDRRIARRHRMSIGTIVGDHMLNVKYNRGKTIGSVEESFISRINPGETFWFGGRNLELIRIKEMNAIVQNSKKKSGRIAVWGGGRMSFSSNMTEMLRYKLNEIESGSIKDVELLKLKPLIDLQQERSHIPSMDELLIEYFETKEGYHLVFYPLEGRLIHEGMAHLIAYRISQIEPRSFSMSFNDYGFELLSDAPIPIQEALESDLFDETDLLKHVQASINAGEMARRKFRDIAVIAGLIFRGYPGMPVRERHLQSSSSLVFDVFEDYDPENLLLRQAYNEVIDHQLEMVRFRKLMKRLRNQRVVLSRPEKPTPFAFPIMADRLRQRLSTEDVEDRIARMSIDYTD